MPVYTPLSPHEVTQRCRAAGLKVTAQRLAIYEALAGRHDHPTPEMLFRQVRERQPSISLATIYKTLDALEAAGLVREVSQLQQAKRYDAHLGAHQHLVCTQCDAITDVELPAKSLAIPRGLARGFRAHAVHVQVLGVCSDCRATPKKRARRSS